MQEDKGYLLIYNPYTGNDKSREYADEVVRILNNESIPYSFDRTPDKHTTEKTLDGLKYGFRKVLVLGGDGTINRVLETLVLQDIVPLNELILGALPMGTGNDWLRTLQLPRNPPDALRQILKGNTMLHDVGQVTYSSGGKRHIAYFINIAGMAYDAYVTYHTNMSRGSGSTGKFYYLWMLFKCLMSYSAVEATVVTDRERRNGKYFSMCAAICKYNGNGMMQAPGAIPDDGLFDLTLIGNLSKVGISLQTPKLYDGTFVNHPKVETIKATHIRVESNSEIFLECDGESKGHGPFDFEIKPLAIRVMI